MATNVQSSSILKGSFTVRVLRNGANAYIEKSVVKFYEVDGVTTELAGSLLQIYSSVDGYSVDWDVNENQPALKLGIETSTGTNLTLTGATFTYDGSELVFNSEATAYDDEYPLRYENDGREWYEEVADESVNGGVSRFAYCKDTVDGEEFYYLRVITNLASAEDYSNKTIGYTLGYTGTDVGSGELSGTEDVILRYGGSSSYSINILADATQLSNSLTEITLSVEAFQGVTQIENLTGSDYFEVEWYKDGENTGDYGDTLTVSRDDVDSSSVYTAHLLYNGSTVATDSIVITDVSDPYQLVTKSLYGLAVGANQTDVISLYIYLNGVEMSNDAVDYAWTIYDHLDNAVREGTGDTITIEYADMAFENTATGTSGYGDVSVSVEATLSIGSMTAATS